MKITLDSIISGFKSVTKLIANFDLIESELNDKVLYRDNPDGEPNQMNNNLDMNGNRITNLPTATDNTDPVTYAQWRSSTSVVQFTGTVVNSRLGSDAAGSTFTVSEYTPGSSNLQVYLNGVLAPASTYTEPTSTTVLMNTAPVSDDEYTFIINSRQVDTDTVPASSVTFTQAGTGAVASNVQTKLQETVSVKDFGAVGDGVTDDTAAIQAAISYGVNNSRSVFLPAGDYLVTDQLMNYSKLTGGSPITVYGEGRGISKISLSGEIADYVFKAYGDTTSYASSSHPSGLAFTGFSVVGDNTNIQRVFDLAILSYVTFHEVNCFQCKGLNLRMRECWEVELGLKIVRGGDVAEHAVSLDYYFATHVADSACNNVNFGKAFQCEASPWTAIYWGRNTRKCTFAGKLHPDLSVTYTAPAIQLDGATNNNFTGANISWNSVQSVRISDDSGYIASENNFTGCEAISGGVELSGDCRRNMFISNGGDTVDASTAFVTLDGGQDNFVLGNMVTGGGPAVSYTNISNLARYELPSRVQVGQTPSAGQDVVLHSFHTTQDEIALFESGDFQSFVRFKDASNTKDIRTGCKGDNYLVQLGGADVLQLDDNTTAGNTKLLVFDVDTGGLARVSVGAADTGGAGFKVLRIPN